MRTIYVGGIHGVGKSTIFQKTRRKIEECDYEILHYSSLMLSVAGNVSSLDDLNSLPYEQRLNIRDKIYKEISSSKKNVVLDSHYSLLIMKGDVPDRFEFGIPETFINNITGFVLIEADSGSVYQRRSKMPGKRRVLSKPLIELELTVERGFAQLACKLEKKDLFVIDNSEDIESACDMLVDFIKMS